MFTTANVLSFARSLKSTTAADAIVQRVDALDRRAASGSHAYSTLLVHVADTCGKNVALNTFGLASDGGITNHRGSVNAWEAMGMSDETIDRLVTPFADSVRPVAVWTLVSSPTYLRQYWSKPEGKDLVKSVAALTTADDKVAAILAALTPAEDKTPKTREEKFLAALKSADALSGSEAGLTLTPAQASEALQYLTAIGATLPVTVAEETLALATV